MKRVQLVAEAVAALCPYCGEPQPNKDGSEMWTAEDFKARDEKRAKARLKADRSSQFTCVACDARFLMTGDTKVMFR